jgi:hypothetical protein
MYYSDHIDKLQFKKVALWKSKVVEIRTTANSIARVTGCPKTAMWFTSYLIIIWNDRIDYTISEYHIRNSVSATDRLP